MQLYNMTKNDPVYYVFDTHSLSPTCYNRRLDNLQRNLQEYLECKESIETCKGITRRYKT